MKQYPIQYVTFGPTDIGWIFDGRWRALDNFYYCDVTIWGKIFSSSEQAFMYQKSDSKQYQRAILTARTPGDAKMLGRQVKLRPDWDEVKVGVMREVLTAKFDQNPHVVMTLLATGDALIYEGNSWHDDCWGVVRDGDRWRGRNILGELLMEQREQRGGAKYRTPAARGHHAQ